MNIAIRSRHFDVSRLNQDMVQNRLSRALRVGSDRVGRIIVRLNDVNGPKGGVDAHCSILIYLNGTNATIHVEDVAETHLQAIARATDRAGRALRRTVGRFRSRRRPRLGLAAS